jgi:glutathione peroxidase
MKKLFLAFISLFSFTNGTNAQNNSMKSFYDFTITDINSKELKLNTLKGKYVLCVNVASKCGYTKQYAQLQELADHYKDKLVIIGFPCNQFGWQEPGTESEILTFCQKNYGVTFPLSQKIDVKGSDQAPIYQWLTNQTLNGESKHSVKWNFHKFLVSPEGKLIGNFSSSVTPLDDEILSLIK